MFWTKRLPSLVISQLIMRQYPLIAADPVIQGSTRSFLLEALLVGGTLTG